MQTKTKKIVAREIIILFSVLLFALLFFFGNLLYNTYQNHRVSEYDKEQAVVVKSIDSLQNAVRPLLNENSIYKFLKANNLTEKDAVTFLSTYKNPDSAKLIYDFMRANKLTDLSDSSFYNKYLSHSDIEKYLRAQNLVRLKQAELATIKAKQSTTQNELLTSGEIRRNIIWFLAISFAVVYLLRPSVSVLKWSLKTLRD